MRSEIIFGGVASLGLVLVMAACSSETIVAAGPGDDAGASTSSGSTGKTSSSGSTSGDTSSSSSSSGSTSSSSGSTSSSGGLKSDTLAQGDVQLLGLAGDDAIYFDFGAGGAVTLNAVPIAGGAPTKIADIADTDQPVVNHGAVAIWTGIADGVGGLNVWTRASSLKSGVATGSAVGIFVASADGSRIAFSQGATLDNANPKNITSTAIGIRDTAAAANAATLTGGSGNASLTVNLASADCSPDIEFVGKVLFAMYCVGATTTTKNAKLIVVPDGATPTPKRIDAATAAATLTLQPLFFADTAGDKVFVTANTNKAGKFINVTTGVVTAIENAMEEGVIQKDGSAVLYRTTAGALKKATTAEPPVITTVVATEVKGLLRQSADDKNLLFNKLAPAAGSPLIDIHTVDYSAAAPAAVDILTTATGVPITYNGTSTHVLFLGDVTATGAKLKSIPIAGGTAKDLMDSVGARPVPMGTGVVVLSNAKKVGTAPDEFTVTDLSHIDSVAGGMPALISDSVPQGEFEIKAKRVVYTKIAQAGSGLYGVTLP